MHVPQTTCVFFSELGKLQYGELADQEAQVTEELLNWLGCSIACVWEVRAEDNEDERTCLGNYVLFCNDRGSFD